MPIQGISEKVRVICENVLVFLLILLAKFFRENTISSLLIFSYNENLRNFRKNKNYLPKFANLKKIQIVYNFFINKQTQCEKQKHLISIKNQLQFDKF